MEKRNIPKETAEMLVRRALEAREFAYCPYSNWAVGAALLTEDGLVYSGCNIENGGLSATNCAERTAFFKAISEGKMHFSAIAIVGGTKGRAPEHYCAPCGVCRQVMAEFCDPDRFLVIHGMSPAEYKVFSLRQLLPEGGFRLTADDSFFRPPHQSI